MNSFPVLGFEFFLHKILPIITSATKSKEFSICKLSILHKEKRVATRVRWQHTLRWCSLAREMCGPALPGEASLLSPGVFSCFSPLLIPIGRAPDIYLLMYLLSILPVIFA
jgi:hypothetical protein